VAIRHEPLGKHAGRPGPGPPDAVAGGAYVADSTRPRRPNDVLYLEWKATEGGRKVEDGVDTFIFRDGMIRV
jgi:hypothetical protein